MTEPAARRSVDVVIPVYNEVKVLEDSVKRTLALFDEHPRYDWHVVVADNGSTDGTGKLAEELASRDPRVRALLLTIKGRGIALREAWTKSTADVVAYMDVDLSTDINHLPKLVSMIADGDCDVAI